MQKNQQRTPFIPKKYEFFPLNLIEIADRLHSTKPKMELQKKFKHN